MTQIKLEASQRLLATDTEAADRTLVFKLAKAQGLELAAWEIAAAKKVGNKTYTVGPEEEGSNAYIMSTFHISANGKKGDFGGAPDGEYKSLKAALAALAKM